MRWGAYPIWLPYDATAALNAARELAAWELTAAVAPEARHLTPLFCGAGGVGTPLKRSEIDDVFARLVTAAVGADEAAKYSMHSFRSYLASAMMASGCSDSEIRMALRWASEDALLLYKHTEEATYGAWLLGAERVRLTAGGRAVELWLNWARPSRAAPLARRTRTLRVSHPRVPS